MRDTAWHTPDFMEGFDPSNMTKKQHDHMLAQVYDGYNTKTSDVWEYRGAGDGRRKRKTGTKETFDPQSYKDNEAWRKVAEAANISNINSKTDIAQMYQFIEDSNNRKKLPELESFSEPRPDPVDNRPVELSEELSSARNNVDDFNNNLDNTGDRLFSRSKDAAQSFKDNYATNLTKAYKQEDPTTLATNKAKMEARSAQKANLLKNISASDLSFSASTYG